MARRALAQVAHLLDQWARARKAPLPLDPVLPADPRVRDLRVTPHALDRYDALCVPEPDEAPVPSMTEPKETSS